MTVKETYVYSTGDKVLITGTSTRTKSVNLAPVEVEWDEPKVVETRLVEVTKHIARVVKRKYVKITEETDNGVETFFDGFCYYCDDGSAYYPDFERNGQVFKLSLATNLDVEIYGD